MATFKRKLYRRGSSFETTIPMALLFKLDLDKKHNVVFEYDNNLGKWLINFEEITVKKQIKATKKKG